MNPLLQILIRAPATLQSLLGTRFPICPILLGLGFLTGGTTVSAHSSSTSLLHLDRADDALHARIEVPLRDLDEQLGLDANDDGVLTWGEIRQRERDLSNYIRQRLVFETHHGVIPVNFAPIQVSRHQGEAFVSVDLEASPIFKDEGLHLRYEILVDRDSLHRCLIQASWSGETRIAGRGKEEVSFPPAWAVSRRVSWFSMVTEGMRHIWTGYDHLLFLFTLLLPSVLCQTGKEWTPRERSRDILREVLQVVTAFTVAHSLTLCAATLGLIHLPPRLVETTIAASILVAALANILPGHRLWDPGAGLISDSLMRFRPRSWVVAFLFGLIHGFGFASALQNLGLEQTGLMRPLLGFNAGVEAGQLAIVAIFLPLVLLIRKTRFYRHALIPIVSTVIMAIAGGWMTERALNLRFMPF
ncbi:MAG: HupE/UreJ family protein [Verrucomicrobiota bacterium]